MLVEPDPGVEQLTEGSIGEHLDVLLDDSDDLSVIEQFFSGVKKQHDVDQDRHC